MFRGLRGKRGSKIVKWTIIVITVTFVGTLLYAGRVLVRPPVDGESTVAATVNGKKILRTQLEAAFRDALLAEYENTGRVLPETRGPIRASVLDQAINGILVAEAARREKVTVSSKDVEAQFKTQEASFPSKDAFRQALAANNLTESQLKRKIKASLTVQALLAIVKSQASVSEDAVKAEYTRQTGKSAEGDDFEAKRAAIQSQLQAAAEQEAVTRWLEGLRKDARIDIVDLEVRAVKKLQEKAYDEAIALYNEAIAKRPDDPYLYVGLAQAHLAKKDMPGGIQALEKAAELYPDEPYVRLLLGTAYKDEGSVDRAVSELTKASESGPMDILLHIRLESLFRTMGREREAQAERAKIAEIRELLERRASSSSGASQQGTTGQAAGTAGASGDASGAGSAAGK